jgi:hypothetical protein
MFACIISDNDRSLILSAGFGSATSRRAYFDRSVEMLYSHTKHPRVNVIDRNCCLSCCDEYHDKSNVCR